jgi:DNA-binding transcriptional LysR family regulator
MRFNHLDLNLLVALNILLAEKNITRAAERLNLTQSSTSNALARLRAYFDDDLLVMSGRRMVLTPRAEGLVEPVREVLIRIESTIAAPPVFDPAREDRRFTLLVSDYTSAVFVPRLVDRLYREAPGVRLDLRAHSDNPAELLDRGEVDLLVIPLQYVAPNHPADLLYEEDFVCVTWSGNTRIREQLSFDDYMAAGHVTTNYVSHERKPAFDGWFLEAYGIQRRIEISTPSLSVLADLVVGTDRIATMHRRLAMRAQESLPIKLWPAPLDIPKLRQMVQCHRDRLSDPALRWLRDCAIEVGRTI